MKSAIANQTKWMNFPDIANFHGAPNKVCPERGIMGCCPHKSDNTHQSIMDFLPWHRLYLGIMSTYLFVLLHSTYLEAVIQTSFLQMRVILKEIIQCHDTLISKNIYLHQFLK